MPPHVNGAEEAAWAEGTYSFKALDSNQTAYAMGASTQRDAARRGTWST